MPIVDAILVFLFVIVALALAGVYVIKPQYFKISARILLASFQFEARAYRKQNSTRDAALAGGPPCSSRDAVTGSPKQPVPQPRRRRAAHHTDRNDGT